jgi:hypothetical protein
MRQIRKFFPLLALSVLLAGCASSDQSLERADNVVIRSSVWGNNHSWSVLVFEYPDGSIKSLNQICQNVIPVWVGGRFDMVFHWSPYRECFVIDGARRR